jgi:hypothetical protein
LTSRRLRGSLTSAVSPAGLPGPRDGDLPSVRPARGPAVPPISSSAFPARHARVHPAAASKNPAMQSHDRVRRDISIMPRRLSVAGMVSTSAVTSWISRADYLRCKVRYFSDRAVLGGKNFVDGIFQAFRDRFGREIQNAREIQKIQNA